MDMHVLWDLKMDFLFANVGSHVDSHMVCMLLGLFEDVGCSWDLQKFGISNLICRCNYLCGYAIWYVSFYLFANVLWSTNLRKELRL